MVQLILEQLVNSMPPEAISLNTESQTSLVMLRVKVIVKELPSISFIWSCWTIIRKFYETLADYRIGEVEKRD